MGDNPMCLLCLLVAEKTYWNPAARLLGAFSS
jgi:hypothetical protein